MVQCGLQRSYESKQAAKRLSCRSLRCLVAARFTEGCYHADKLFAVSLSVVLLSYAAHTDLLGQRDVGHD